MNENPAKRVRREVILRASIVLGVIAVLAGGALFAAAKFERQRGPEAGPLLRSVSKAIEGKRAVSFNLTGKMEGSGNLSGDAEKMSAGDEVALRGYLGPNGFEVRGNFAGHKDVRVATDHSLIAIHYEGRWYGQRLNEPITGLDPQRLDVSGLLPYFQPYSYAGERVRGKPTWRLPGDLRNAESEPNPFIDTEALMKAVAFAVSVDRKTRLPVLLEGSISGSLEDWVTVPTQGVNLGRIDVELRFELFDWGKEKPVSTPSSFRPMERLYEKAGAGDFARGL